VGKKMAAVHFTTCLVNLTQTRRHKESQIFTIFVPVLKTLSSLGLKIFNVSVHFYERCYGFHALRTMDKCTIRHLFSYGGLQFTDGLKEPGNLIITVIKVVQVLLLLNSGNKCRNQYCKQVNVLIQQNNLPPKEDGLKICLSVKIISGQKLYSSGFPLWQRN